MELYTKLRNSEMCVIEHSESVQLQSRKLYREDGTILEDHFEKKHEERGQAFLVEKDQIFLIEYEYRYVSRTESCGDGRRQDYNYSESSPQILKKEEISFNSIKNPPKIIKTQLDIYEAGRKERELRDLKREIIYAIRRLEEQNDKEELWEIHSYIKEDYPIRTVDEAKKVLEEYKYKNN